MASAHTKEMLAAAVAACEDKKAEDIRILELDPTESGLTDYFLICNGTNERQNVAITDEVEIRLKREFGEYPKAVEGRRQGEWILMDYVDFIVHVFSAEKRAFYGLERLRKSATSLSLSELNADIKKQITSTRKKAAAAPQPVATKTAAPKKPAAKKAAAKKTVAKTPAKKSLSTKQAASAASKTGMKSAKKAASKPAVAKKTTAAGKKTTVKKTTKKK